MNAGNKSSAFDGAAENLYAIVGPSETASPYARVGAKLIDSGFSAIPILAGGKRPAINDWPRFCDRLPTDLESRHWSDGSYGVGVACGMNGLVAVDFDTNDHRIIDAVKSVLPYALVEKVGSRGFTAFYRASAPVESRGFDIDGKRVLDILSDGRQSVIPPSLHPKTGRPYVWTTPLGLGDVSPEHLELLVPDFIERIEEALKPLGYQRPLPKREYDRDLDDEAQDAAMADFDAWVPHLGIPFVRSPNGKYRAVAVWRGGENYNVSIAPQGIKDFASGEPFSPEEFVKRALGVDGLDANIWLCERLGIPTQSRAEFEAFVTTFLESLRRMDAPKTLSSTAAEIMAADVGEPEFIVDGWLQNRKVGTLLGEDGAGKSFLLLDLAIAAATGWRLVRHSTRAYARSPYVGRGGKARHQSAA